MFEIKYAMFNRKGFGYSKSQSRINLKNKILLVNKNLVLYFSHRLKENAALLLISPIYCSFHFKIKQKYENYREELQKALEAKDPSGT